jgi:DNA-binding NtrC family response regulator/predicted hydrocarbon binding protein
MRAADLDLQELLDVDPQGGIVRFAGQRALILDAVALGILRKELIDTLGVTAARAVLTRFGYAYGWRTAESMQSQLTFDNEEEMYDATRRIITLKGLLIIEHSPPPPEGGPKRAIWRASYEAEQHLLHLGLSEHPVCWTLCGFASGFVSKFKGKEMYFVEERCVGKGDAACEVVGQTCAEWGNAIEEHVPFFRKSCLNSSLEQVTDALKRTERQLRERRRELARAAGTAEDPSGLAVQSESMRRVVDLARRVAKVESTVLITGESGSGKERIARLVHDASARSGGPFVALNCAAVTETLLESELFGHARGAFTGATQDRPGLFEAANGGTLLLDEVGEIPISMQVKLLRALQEREVRRVGENRNRPIDVRVVAATNRSLDGDVAAGRFRKDLYYRLKVVELKVPALRERREDILPLARVLLADAGKRLGRPMEGLTPQAADQLLRYRWPGNVRELENAMERTVALADGSRVDVDDLPEEVREAPPEPISAGAVRRLEDVERDYILSALAANGGNQTQTAAQLGIGTATLYRKLKSYRAAPPKLKVVRP